MSNFFASKLEEAKQKTQSELTKKLQSEKVNLIRAALKNDDIKISEDCVDVSSVKRELKDKLSDIEYDNAVLKIDGISKELDGLLENLENGSANSIQKFIKKTEKYFKPIAKAATFGLASRAAVILAPTIVSKLAVTGALMAGSLYKISKSRKAGNVISREMECNRILNELEITKGDNDTVIDTRFSEEVQSSIRDFLKTNNVNFLDTGYLSLRQTIYSLDFDKKRKLCSIINNKLGRDIDINARIESKMSNSLFKDFKKTAITSTAGVATGVGVATAINSVDPAILAGPINGSVLGTILFGMTNSSSAAVAGGATGIAGTVALEYIPVVGEAFENIFATENLIAGAVTGGLVGAGVGVASVLGAQAVKTIKNMHNQFSGMKEQKKLLEFDSTKYAEDNKTEIEKMQDVTLRSNNPVEQVLFNLVYEYMTDDLNVEFKKTPTTLGELTECIESCDKKEKRKIHSFVGKLRECNKDRSDFVNTMVKVGNAAKTVATVGLAGLSTLDILKDGTLLPEISRKIFKDVPNNIYLMIPEKTDITKMDYKGEIADRTDDYSMIENVTQAKENYQNLEGMEKEVDSLTAFDTEYMNDISTANHDLKEAGKDTLWENVKTTFKLLFTDPSRLKDYFSSACDSIQGKTEIVTDIDKINSTVNSLPQDQLVDLAYYFNTSSDIDRSTAAYQAIGNAMQSKLNMIQDGINEYNKMMDSINTTSKAITDVAVVSQGVAGISDKQK